jgi:acyl-coenzyme A synthetase/AMP-(fatty) acid ligase
VSAAKGPFRLDGGALSALGARVALEGHGALGARVTYGELAARAASVWRELRRAGVLPNDPVALVSSGRAHDEAVGLTGILTSGSVAVPLDATAPPQRLAGILKARGCYAMVLDAAAMPIADAIDAELSRGAPEGHVRLARVVLDGQGTLIAGAAREREGVDAERAVMAARLAAQPEPGTLACILHTSGSTGTPKPVPITWAGLDAFTAWAIELVALRPEDRVLRVAELIFDLAWFDHIATLRAGATLVTMTRRELSAGAALRDAMRSLEPTVVYGVPSLFMKLTAALPAGEPVPAPLRAVLFAGEVFPPRELAAFAERVPAAELYNLYGPTETNVCTYHRVDRASLDGARETPIGVACPYARCSLTEEGDEGGRVIEGPGTGELVVEGPTTVGGGPYATRDRVERGEDGLLYFRGRIDRMVKIRGYRVEPGEVEAVLGAHPAARQAAVIVRDDARLGKTLRAYLELRPDADDPGDRALRMFLAERLPPYMVPEKVISLRELPRTSTGKVDYRGLG